MEKRASMKVDFTECDREPIHISGHIQPFGFLLIVDKNTLKIEQGSENTGEYLGVNIQDLTGEPLVSLFVEEANTPEELLPAELTDDSGEKGPHLLNLKGRQFFCFIHQSAAKIILECESFTSQSAEEAIEANNLLGSVQTKLNQLGSLEEISAPVADAVQAMLDYDRVLIFKFDPDWHGKVIAEKAKPGIHSYKGHHFPASDIPAPARELLRVKHIRHIPKVAASPVAILPYQNPSTGSPTDILKSEFRYPSEIHLEYLENMDVSGSLSFSVIVKGELWGLISCTNEKPKYINYWKRQLGNQLAKAYANVIVSSQEKRDYHEFVLYKKQEEELLRQIMSSGNDFSEGLLKEELNLLSISRAAGAVIFLDKSIRCFGICPEEKVLKELVDWLSQNNTASVFYTRQLSAIVKSAASYRDKGSGLLALEISRFNKEYLLYFKPEITEKRIWAGNPEKPIAGNDLHIHPRKSFEKWEEEIKGKSEPWTVNEVEIAGILLKDVVAVRLGNQAIRLERLKEEYQIAAEGLEIQNKQLEDFARIITHNLRSPLTNVQALYAIYKANPQQYEAPLFLDKIKGASDNMLATIDDLNLILRKKVGAHLQQEKVNIRKIIDKELQNMEAVILAEKAEVIIALSVQEININKIYLESIIHNLISNALKYTSPKRRPRLEIRSWQEEKTFYFSVSDNGLGIDLDKYGEKIFGIYKTFHQHPNSRGVGLYITKMQVEGMGGNIEVQSQPGEGTTFTIKFNHPVSFSRQENMP
jgi:chemotaxis family two-component system sensor kinase Cph1